MVDYPRELACDLVGHRWVVATADLVREIVAEYLARIGDRVAATLVKLSLKTTGSTRETVVKVLLVVCFPEGLHGAILRLTVQCPQMGQELLAALADILAGGHSDIPRAFGFLTKYFQVRARKTDGSGAWGCTASSKGLSLLLIP